MPRITRTLAEEDIALMWRIWVNELLNTAEQEIRRKAAAYLARKVDIIAVANQARRDIIRGLTDSLLAEDDDQSD